MTEPRRFLADNPRTIAEFKLGPGSMMFYRLIYTGLRYEIHSAYWGPEQEPAMLLEWKPVEEHGHQFNILAQYVDKLKREQ